MLKYNLTNANNILSKEGVKFCHAGTNVYRLYIQKSRVDASRYHD